MCASIPWDLIAQEPNKKKFLRFFFNELGFMIKIFATMPEIECIEHEQKSFYYSCIKVVKNIVYFYVSNILEIKENYKWICFLYNVTFNILIYIL
jgi:hypothetical protein